MFISHARLAAATLLTMISVVSSGCLTSSTRTVVEAPVESPIDINTSAVVVDLAQPDLVIHYDPHLRSRVLMKYNNLEPCQKRSREEDVRGLVAGGSFITYGQVRYELLNVHYHTPSEHTVDDESTEMEVHLVHQSSMGDYLALAVHLTVSSTPVPSEHDRLLTSTPPTETCPPEVPQMSVRRDIALRELLPANLTAFRYLGSLTTRLCGAYLRPVQWIVFKERMTIQASTHAAYSAIWPEPHFPHGNSKPVTVAKPDIREK
ncbi:carbonic anhydrase family protein [Sinosporangium siamense]|uniref:carbonic anhydrase n=1 Tax=Sinosporangium siamense TaxID=1367973 RepID=A0A919V5V2_9ACTN|nr:carbonic anhydrase family protein [Sinosporangium siamense]GII91863.1 carbonate dehydratase [Sinosporangium siamense]